MKDGQKKQLLKYNEKKMVLSGQGDATTVEQSLPGMLLDSSASAPTHALPLPSPPPSPKDEIDPSVNPKVLKAQEKMQQRMKDATARLQEREDKLIKDRDTKRQRKEEDAAAAKAAKEAFAESLPGKAQQFSAFLDRDIEKCRALSLETATCGMRVGFAREWKVTFDNICKDLVASKGNMQALENGTTADEKLLETAQTVGANFKAEINNFKTSKRLMK